MGEKHFAKQFGHHTGERASQALEEGPAEEKVTDNKSKNQIIGKLSQRGGKIGTADIGGGGIGIFRKPFADPVIY